MRLTNKLPSASTIFSDAQAALELCWLQAEDSVRDFVARHEKAFDRLLVLFCLALITLVIAAIVYVFRWWTFALWGAVIALFLLWLSGPYWLPERVRRAIADWDKAHPLKLPEKKPA